MRHRIVIAAVIALSLLACAKKRPGETPQESVARKRPSIPLSPLPRCKDGPI